MYLAFDVSLSFVTGMTKSYWPNLHYIRGSTNAPGLFGVYLGVNLFCFVDIVRVRVYYVDFFVFFVLRHW